MRTIDHLPSEAREEIEQYANVVVVQVLRKHAGLLRQRAKTSPDAKLVRMGLLDAAELAEATASNLEVLCR